MEHARRAIVVADGSKAGRVAFAEIAPLERVGELITDGSADAEALAAIRDAGVEVTIV
jgi:DeoR family transcriptional regulator of aga operon